MVQFNFNYKSKYKIFFIILMIFLVLWTRQIYAFNPNDYEKDKNQKHFFQCWRHEDGHIFADNARVFYDIPGITLVPCRTYQEYANKSQLVGNATGIALNFVPPAKLFWNGFKTLMADKILDHKDDGVAMINDIVRYYILNDEGKAFFFFETNQLDEIKQVDITFCDCNMSPSLITSVIEFLNHLTEFLDDPDFDNLIEKLISKGEFSNKELKEMGIQQSDIEIISQYQKIPKTIKNKIKEYIKKKINQKVGHAIAKTALKTGTKKVVGKTWGKVLFPEVFEAVDMGEKKYESQAHIKNNIHFEIKNNSYETTLGFAINFPNKNELEIYELKKTSECPFMTKLINKVNLFDSTHMLINLIQPKRGLDPNKYLNIYCGKEN
ncbi:hypothetical protein [Candidatus Phytoplasma sp. AldY-WA1]|uniref:hypothetical protein n=1 Tax=Candidatus Phytoplasma sp. AldY-WA1 TaxID=2852100 RepID=UPI00254E99F2|nr:hypothetical protein [Candidatus Phytoplasma sp. AldY-WA1]